MSLAEATGNDQVRAAIQTSVDAANALVSKAESIRSFIILDADFSVESGHLTPSLKLKRNVVLKEFAGDVDALYS
jgi:long-chain acyl-CoA synthetase